MMHEELKPYPFSKIRLSLMFAAEHELPIELGVDEIWSVLIKLDQLSAETGKALTRAEAAERDLAALKERTRWIPFREGHIPVNSSEACARIINGEWCWTWLPEIPEPPEVE